MIRFRSRDVSPELATLYRSLNVRSLFEERVRKQAPEPFRSTDRPARPTAEIRP